MILSSDWSGDGAARMSGTSGIQFTFNDFAMIQDVHSFSHQIFKLLVNSLCPAIFGQNLVKVNTSFSLVNTR